MATRKEPDLDGLPADAGDHKGHSILPHRHVPVDGKLKPCSGRWMCATCKATGDASGKWWFSAAACHVEGK